MSGNCWLVKSAFCQYGVNVTCVLESKFKSDEKCYGLNVLGLCRWKKNGHYAMVIRKILAKKLLSVLITIDLLQEDFMVGNTFFTVANIDVDQMESIFFIEILSNR